MQSERNVRKLVFAAVIAAAYVVMTLVLYPISYGEIQFRISEVLAILPYFYPIAVPGLFVGCIISNILSPFGFADMIIGSSATLIASLLTMYIGKSKRSERISVKAIACLPPVMVNAVFLGALFAYFMVGEGSTDAFWFAFYANMLQVGFGQAVVLYVLGLPLMIYLPGTGIIDKLRSMYTGNEK